MTSQVSALLGDLSIDALRSSGSMKWSQVPSKMHGHDTLPAFVAEMDFAPAQPVRDALMKWAQRGSLGYRSPALVENFQGSISHYYATIGLDLSTHMVRPISDVMTAYDAVARIFTPAEAPITLLTPAYMNFVRHDFGDGRPIQTVQMLPPDTLHSQWRIDWQALEQALVAGGLLVLVNPHNPIGKVYTEHELRRIAQLATRYGVRVFADEIHSPLVYSGASHIPFASISDAAAHVAITAWSATKAFSIPGTKAACLIFTNPKDLIRWRDHGQHYEMGTATSGYLATIAALNESQEWFEAVMSQLTANRDALSELVPQFLPGVGFNVPEATYLAWLDLRETPNYARLAELVTQQRSLAEVTAQACGVITTDGAETGRDGVGHLRVNFATGPEILDRIVTQLAVAFSP